MAYAFLIAASGQAGPGASSVDTNAFDSTGATIIYVGGSGAATFGGGDVTDNKGNTFVPTAFADSNVASTILVCDNPNTGTGHVITIGSGQAGISVACFSGGTNGLDQSTGSTTDTNVTTQSTGALTPSVANQLAVAHLALSGGIVGGTSSEAVNSGFTIVLGVHGVLIPPSGEPRYGSFLAYYINPPLSSLNPTFTWSGAIPSAAILTITDPPASTGEIKTRNEMAVNPTPVVKARNGLALASILRINELKPN